MKVAIIPWNDEWRAGVIFGARDHADKVLVVTSNETVENLARLFGAEVIKLKDYDKIDAIYLGLRKAKEMGYEPLVILEDLSKDEFPEIAPLLKDCEFIIGSRYIGKDDVKKCNLFNKDNNYKRIILGYQPKEPATVGVKVFYITWCLITGLRIATKRLWRKIRY